jgi:hypothetical protein
MIPVRMENEVSKNISNFLNERKRKCECGLFTSMSCKA